MRSVALRWKGEAKLHYIQGICVSWGSRVILIMIESLHQSLQTLVPFLPNNLFLMISFISISGVSTDLLGRTCNQLTEEILPASAIKGKPQAKTMFPASGLSIRGSSLLLCFPSINATKVRPVGKIGYCVEFESMKDASKPCHACLGIIVQLMELCLAGSICCGFSQFHTPLPQMSLKISPWPYPTFHCCLGDPLPILGCSNGSELSNFCEATNGFDRAGTRRKEPGHFIHSFR